MCQDLNTEFAKERLRRNSYDIFTESRKVSFSVLFQRCLLGYIYREILLTHAVGISTHGMTGKQNMCEIEREREREHVQKHKKGMPFFNDNQ